MNDMNSILNVVVRDEERVARDVRLGELNISVRLDIRTKTSGLNIII